MRRLTFGVAALVLVLSSCEMRAEVEVNEDGSGSFGFMFGMEPLFFMGLPPSANPMAEARRQLKNDVVEWEITEIDEPSLKGFRARTRFDDMQHLDDIMKALAEERDALEPRAGLGEEFVIERAGDGWRLSARAETPGLGNIDRGLPDLELPDGVEIPGFNGEDFEFDVPAEAEDLLRFEFHVTLPGKASVSNAEEIFEKDGKSTFVWRASAFDGDEVTLEALTVAAPSSSGIPMLPLIVVLLVAAAAAAVVLARRRVTGPPVVLEGLPPIAYEYDGGHGASGGQPLVAADSASDSAAD